MKKRIALLIIAWLVLLPCWASAVEVDNETLNAILKKLEAPADSKCPIPEKAYAGMDCFKCHIQGDFSVKETIDNDKYVYPNKFMERKVINDEEVMVFFLSDIPWNELRDCFTYMENNGLKKIIIEIHSGGGGIYDALRNKNIIEHYRNKGFVIETHMYGLAASAGLFLFLTGDTQLISPGALGMWHEIQSFSVSFGISIKRSTPSSSEEEARIMRWLNNVMQAYIAERTNLTIEELDKQVKNRELWITDAQAIEYGFATGLLQ